MSVAVRRIRDVEEEYIGLEARAQANDHVDVKIWLRLLGCGKQIEQKIRSRLRTRFATTLPRFDYLAQLNRHPEGLRMNVLSRYLMVTNANVTLLTVPLIKAGLIRRIDDPEDGRSYLVVLTEKGRAEFLVMAAEHKKWLTELLTGLGRQNKAVLFEQLGILREHLSSGSGDHATRSRQKPILYRRSEK